MPESLRASLLAAGKIRSLWPVIAGLPLLALCGGLVFALPSSDPLAGVALCRANAAGSSAAIASGGRGYADRKFMAENEVVMTQMMSAMAISPSGDVDRDFVAMMVAHHQGAIDMAMAELRYGRNELLRRIAQEIVVTQGQEIRAMRNATLTGYSAPSRQGASASSGQAAMAFGATKASP